MSQTIKSLITALNDFLANEMDEGEDGENIVVAADDELGAPYELLGIEPGEDDDGHIIAVINIVKEG